MFDNNIISKVQNSNFAQRDVNIWNNMNSDKPPQTMQILYENATPGAFHDSNERLKPPVCHEGTRVAVRQDLMDVVQKALSHIVWLYGAAGAGKSAIAQSFADTCQKKGLLIGTFFFFRDATWCNNITVWRLAASLAYQLGRAIPSTLPFIEHAMTSNPAIFSSRFEVQIDQLFVTPLHRAYEEDPTLISGPRVVILDGLDECNTTDVQKDIITVLEKALHNTPFPIVVIVVSRPEFHLKSAFESVDCPASIKILRFDLNNTSKYDTDADIRIYLNDRFAEIQRYHPFKNDIPDAWPVPSDIDLIIEKSSGQFIFTATVMRYIEQDQCLPYERLKMALDASTRFASAVCYSLYKDLDALYLQIFSGVEKRIITLAILYLALNVGGEKMGHAQWPRTMAFRLGIPLPHVKLHMYSLASLVEFDGEDKPLRIFHASLLRDFLVNECRSGDLYIEQPAVHTFLSTAYMRHFLDSTSEFYHVLDSCSYHIPLAELDEQLSAQIECAQRKMPDFIKGAIRSDSGTPKWYDDGSFSEGTSMGGRYFCDLIQSVHNLKVAILVKAPENVGFWEQCLEAIHCVFKVNLAVCLGDANIHAYLALVVFTNGDEFPHPNSTSSLGMPSLPLDSIDIFNSRCGPKPFQGVAREVLREFLLNPQCSGGLYITPGLTQVALNCLELVMKTSLSRDIPSNHDLSREDETYLWAVRSMTCMLQWASKSQQLINVLETYNHHLQWLAHYPEDAEASRNAMDLYLSTHLPKLATADATKSQQILEEARSVPVPDAVFGDAVKDPSTNNHGRKRSRGVLANLRRLFTMKNKSAESSKTSTQQEKKKKWTSVMESVVGNSVIRKWIL